VRRGDTSPRSWLASHQFCSNVDDAKAHAPVGDDAELMHAPRRGISQTPDSKQLAKWPANERCPGA